ncbi:PIN domain-containing protein [bacterium]|nr:PIN domain-containing protein [bacterium]MBU1615299.1 PIN domain-containing protein [bacterium]
MKLFVDTGAFLAIEDKADNHHRKALSFHRKALKENYQLLTTDYILDETYTLIRRRAGHRFAVEFGEKIRGSRLIKVLPITPTIIDIAWNIFKKYEDKDFSFTDCTSFVIMEQNKIKNAFAFDGHFIQYGFQIFPKLTV